MYTREETRIFLATRVARPASAGVIVETKSGEALVLKAHYKSYWSFPGGWIEHGQTPRVAAVRELLEETGLDFADSDVDMSFVVSRSSELMQTFQFIFKAKHSIDKNIAIKLQASEIAEYKFVSKDDVLQNQDDFGGAVVAWAQSKDDCGALGYYEQRLD
ncbi:NUDIX hydrolase [Candidatus Saccharibacteria bacterium]|jgi:8-oxo-dGTP pyrophosphatase MutT (NUDIX family)|nr:NUDIX hydrolase [Candidatus Saccharibacteria bacterium]